MNKCVKLTTQDLTTHDGFQWEVGRWYETSGEGELCDTGWLHGYDSIEIAVFLNPAHANLKKFIAWEAEWGGERKDDRGLKFGATRMRLADQIEAPSPTTEQHIAFGILCALEVYDDPRFVEWAEQWLSGEDRSADAAWAADAAEVAAEVAAYAAADATEAAGIDLRAIAIKALSSTETWGTK